MGGGCNFASLQARSQFPHNFGLDYRFSLQGMVFGRLGEWETGMLFDCKSGRIRIVWGWKSDG